MMIFGDSKSNGPQFSKLITILCVLIVIVTLIVIPILAIYWELATEICISLITAAGALGSTAVVWNLKKSQAENTIKIYLSAYKEIIELKQDNSLINNMEEQIITKIDDCVEENLNDATTLIEKQEIL